MIHVEQRASTVLYKFLVSNCIGYTFYIPANVCPIVPLTFLKAGVDFSFIDINLLDHAGDYDLYLDKIEASKEEKIGVLFVNSYGKKREVENFYNELRTMNTTVIIEDDCLCVPDISRTSPSVCVDLELYSTGYSKYVQLPRGGGMV